MVLASVAGGGTVGASLETLWGSCGAASVLQVSRGRAGGRCSRVSPGNKGGRPSVRPGQRQQQPAPSVSLHLPPPPVTRESRCPLGPGRPSASATTANLILLRINLSGITVVWPERTVGGEGVGPEPAGRRLWMELCSVAAPTLHRVAAVHSQSLPPTHRPTDRGLRFVFDFLSAMPVS